MEVPPAQAIEPTACQGANEPRRALGRGPGRVVRESAGHLGADEPRTDREDRHAACELVRQRLTEPADGSLARCVGAVGATGEVRRAAAGDHDSSTLSLEPAGY